MIEADDTVAAGCGCGVFALIALNLVLMAGCLVSMIFRNVMK